MDGNRITRCWGRALGFVPGVLALFLFASSADAQIVTGIRNVTLRATTASNLTIAIPTGGAMNFTLLQGAIANGSVAAQITTSWNLNPGQTGAVSLYGYFTTPSAALAGTTANIASTYVEGRVLTGSPIVYTAFTQTNPVGPAGGSLLLFTETITGTNKTKTRNDNLNIRINLTTSPVLPAENYTGILRIQGRAL